MPLTHEQEKRLRAMLDKLDNAQGREINEYEPEHKVFISYRRLDSAGYVNHIYDLLLRDHGLKRENVFRDIDTIDYGIDFVEAIDSAIRRCTVFLAVVGPLWSTISNDEGRRLDDPNDFVRLEIATALSREIRVIPVLVGGASMPSSENLPEDIMALSRRNALEVSDRDFHTHVARLARAIKRS